MRYLNVILKAIMAFLFLFSMNAYAAVSSYDGAFTKMMNGVVNATPGMTGVVVSSDAAGLGARLATNTSMAVTTAEGLRIPVAVGASTLIGKSALATAAARLAMGASLVGAAYTGYEMYKVLKDMGITTCAAPNFLCKAGTTAASVAATGALYTADNMAARFTTAAEAALVRAQKIYADGACTKAGPYCPTKIIACTEIVTSATSYKDTCTTDAVGYPTITVIGSGTNNQCASGYTYNLSTGVCDGVTTDPTPYVDAQTLASEIASKSGWPSKAGDIYNAVQTDNAKQKLLTQAEVVPLDSTVTVTAPAVQTAPQVVKTATITNADGTTSTVTETATSTVTPQISGTGTLSNLPTVTPDVSTVIKTTTVNNTTNNTTTNTTTVSDTAQPAQDSGLCSLFPNIAACQELGAAPTADTVPTSDATPSITSVAFSSSASCPAPISFSLGRFGGSQSIDWTPFCNWAAGVRAIFLALATIATAWIFMESLKS